MAKVPEHFYEQSAAVPYRVAEGCAEVLLVTSISKGRWIVPKGVVEPHLTPAASAAQEAYEEAGVRGTAEGPALGNYRYEKWGGVCRVEVFALRVTEVLETWPEKDARKRAWVPLEDAAERVAEKKLAKLIRKLAERLEKE
ncbi:MAG: NUDIX hydrolase [Planctomycetes bacterium]|nr:NUDIX hydrolase [Planctomycetota bacterium]